jgi:hypothetical protein
MQRQLRHQVQGIAVVRFESQRALAAHLRIEIALGVQMLETL